MSDLLTKLLDAIGNPTVIALALGFALLIAVIWRLFDKQMQFIEKRVDLLRQENQDLRSQLNLFREENTRLKELTARLSEILHTIQRQPLLAEDVVSQLNRLSRDAGFAGANLPALREVAERILKQLEAVAHEGQKSSEDLAQGFAMLESSLRKGGVDEQARQMLYQLIQAIEQTEVRRAERLHALAEESRRMLES